MRDAMRGTEFVGQLIAAEAMTSFQRARRIVQAGVDDATIARARAHADFGERFQDEDVAPAAGESAGDGATHDAAANDRDVGLFHGLSGRLSTRSQLFISSIRETNRDLSSHARMRTGEPRARQHAELSYFDLCALRNEFWRARTRRGAVMMSMLVDERKLLDDTRKKRHLGILQRILNDLLVPRRCSGLRESICHFVGRPHNVPNVAKSNFLIYDGLGCCFSHCDAFS